MLTSQCLASLPSSWRTSQEKVVLSLASDKVSNNDKALMASALLSKQESEDPEDGALCVDGETQLPDLVDESSWLVFQLLGSDARHWLSKPVSIWETDDKYQENQQFVRELKVTNDVAERGIALIQAFANTVTRDEQQLEWLLQAVEAHRKRTPSFQKKYLDSL